MRRILLATAALAIFGVNSAWAVGPQSQGVEITATVTPTCTMSQTTPDVSFGPDPIVGASVIDNAFSFSCNFVGNEGGTLFVKFQSLNGGLFNAADADPDRTYDVVYNGGLGDVTLHSDTDLNPGPFSVAETALFGANNRTFDVVLTQSLDYAGGYADTLTISVAP